MSLELPEERRLSLGADNEDNESHKVSSLVDEEIQIIEKEEPLKYKIIALICVLSLALGSHYSAHTLDPLKSIVKEEFGISNSQYGVIQSSVSLVNTIIPILGGVFIDTFGTLVGSVLATSLIAIGNILAALSTDLKSFTLMVVGRILYGIGSGTIVVIQVAILSYWFQGKGLAIAVGIQIAVSRLSSFLSNLTVVPITRITGSYRWAFWFTAFLCIFSLTVNLIYVFLVRIFYKKLNKEEMSRIKRRKHFNPKKLLIFPTIYWVFVLLEFVLSSSWSSFLTINTELVKIRWNNTNENAAYNSSIAQFLPIFVSPFLGYFLDRFGNRTLILIISTVFLTISMHFLGFATINPIVGMVFFSISLSLGPVTTLSSIPILLPLDYVGTALGVVKSVSNIGTTIYDIFVGYLQDLDKGKYEKVMIFYLSNSVLSIAIAIGLLFISKHWYNGLLDMKEVERKKLYNNEKIHEFINNDDIDIKKYFYIGFFICVLILSWVLFFNFVI